jgi:hypothetical protein
VEIVLLRMKFLLLREVQVFRVAGIFLEVVHLFLLLPAVHLFRVVVVMKIHLMVDLILGPVHPAVLVFLVVEESVMRFLFDY